MLVANGGHGGAGAGGFKNLVKIFVRDRKKWGCLLNKAPFIHEHAFMQILQHRDMREGKGEEGLKCSNEVKHWLGWGVG